MRVANRHRQRVGCVGAFERGVWQQALHHHTDLILVRAAGPDDRHFDGFGRILGDADAQQGRGEQSDATGIAQFQRGAAIAVDIGLLAFFSKS